MLRTCTRPGNENEKTKKKTRDESLCGFWDRSNGIAPQPPQHVNPQLNAETKIQNTQKKKRKIR